MTTTQNTTPESTKAERRFRSAMFQFDRALNLTLRCPGSGARWVRLRCIDNTYRVLLEETGYNLHKFLGMGQPCGETVLEGNLQDARTEVSAFLLQELNLDIATSQIAQDVMNGKK